MPYELDGVRRREMPVEIRMAYAEDSRTPINGISDLDFLRSLVTGLDGVRVFPSDDERRYFIAGSPHHETSRVRAVLYRQGDELVGYLDVPDSSEGNPYARALSERLGIPPAHVRISPRRDLNSRPPAYHADALPG